MSNGADSTPTTDAAAAQGGHPTGTGTGGLLSPAAVAQANLIQALVRSAISSTISTVARRVSPAIPGSIPQIATQLAQHMQEQRHAAPHLCSGVVAISPSFDDGGSASELACKIMRGGGGCTYRVASCMAVSSGSSHITAQPQGGQHAALQRGFHASMRLTPESARRRLTLPTQPALWLSVNANLCGNKSVKSGAVSRLSITVKGMQHVCGGGGLLLLWVTTHIPPPPKARKTLPMAAVTVYFERQHFYFERQQDSNCTTN